MVKLAFIKRDCRNSYGLEKMGSLIYTALAEKGADITLFSTQNYSPRGFLNAQKLKDFDRWVSQKTSAFDVIFSMDRTSSQTHHRAGNGVHAAYLDLRSQIEGIWKKWSFAINPLHQLHLDLEKKTFESPQTKVIIVNSEMVRRQILEYYNTPPSKIHVIHNSIDYHDLTPDFENSLNLRNPSTFQFIFIARNFQRKGLEPLLRALPLLSDKNFHLSVLGSDKNEDWYKKLCYSLGLQKHVSFFPPTHPAKPLYLAADALVVPSMYDPFANVTLEALALGLFVVSSRANGGHEVLTETSGVVIDHPHNIEELASGLEIARKFPKTATSALQIRKTISHLDHSIQMEKICSLCLG